MLILERLIEARAIADSEKLGMLRYLIDQAVSEAKQEVVKRQRT